MPEIRPKIRLFVDADLGPDAALELSAQANYLVNVMRKGVGDVIAVFNGRDGEFAAEILKASKRNVLAVCRAQTAPLVLPPDLWLIFAPIKKARTDFIVEKAAEMGAARILPVMTRFTNAERLRIDRLQTHAIEAAEQCGGTFVPEVAEVRKLDRLLSDWPEDRHLMFCDERQTALPVAEALSTQSKGKWAILIGPEGGFSSDEALLLHALPQCTPVTLGPRILRADTAAVAAMAAWQMHLGDWG